MNDTEWLQKGLDDLKATAEKIRGHTESMAVSVGQLETAVELHVADKEIHHQPYCNGLKRLSNRMWGLLAAGLVTVASAVVFYMLSA